MVLGPLTFALRAATDHAFECLGGVVAVEAEDLLMSAHLFGEAQTADGDPFGHGSVADSGVGAAQTGMVDEGSRDLTRSACAASVKLGARRSGAALGLPIC